MIKQLRRIVILVLVTTMLIPQSSLVYAIDNIDGLENVVTDNNIANEITNEDIQDETEVTEDNNLENDVDTIDKSTEQINPEMSPEDLDTWVPVESISDEDFDKYVSEEELTDDVITETYATITRSDAKQALLSFDLYNDTLEIGLDEILKKSELNTIGEWFFNLSNDDQKRALEISEVLNWDTLKVEDGELSNQGTKKYWETAIEYWQTTQAQQRITSRVKARSVMARSARSVDDPRYDTDGSLISWDPEWGSVRKGSAKFYMSFWCDGEKVGTYLIDCPYIMKPSNNTTQALSLGYISGSLKTCSKGHNLNVSFSRIEAVNDTRDYWSGIRIFGRYTRPAGYITKDYGESDYTGDYTGGYSSVGLFVKGAKRFGTDTYGALNTSNKYLLDISHNTTPIVDEFCFEGDAYQIGLGDRGGGTGFLSISNYGMSIYNIVVEPAGLSYRINPNGGYYNGSKDKTTYNSLNATSSTVTIDAPVWNSTTEGKSFTGWTLNGTVVDQNGNTKTGSINTTASTILKYTSTNLVGTYVNKSMSNKRYDSYLKWNLSEITDLTAQWKLDWVNVKFNANKPSGSGTVTNLTPTSKHVNYQQAYGTLPQPEVYGYYFLGWYTHPTDGALVSSSTICNATTEHTLYAHWQKALFHLDFNLNRPSGYESATVTGMDGYTNGKDLWYQKGFGYLPSNNSNNNWPTPFIASNVSFLGWYTSPVGGQQITATTTVTSLENRTVYAHWNEQLYLDSSVNLTGNPTTIGGTAFNKGSVRLDWSKYRAITGYFNTYYRPTGTAAWTRTQRKITNKTYQDINAMDYASPNAIANNGLNKDRNTVQNATRVHITKPSDRGTSYDFYVSERTYVTANGQGKTFDYSSSVQSYTTPWEAKYTLQLLGAGSGSGQKGAYLTGDKEIVDGVSVYALTGGKGGQPTGGTNGGAAGGQAGGYKAYGGGGATHLSTVNRGTTSSFASYQSDLYAVAAGAGGDGGDAIAIADYRNDPMRHYYSGTYSYIHRGYGGNSGNNGGQGYNKAPENTGYFFGVTSNGGYANGTGGSAVTNFKITPGSPPCVGYGLYGFSGSGGGGGAGWPGGGGGSSGTSPGRYGYSGEPAGIKNDIIGSSGSNGSRGLGGKGGNGFQQGYSGMSGEDRKRYPTGVGSGGGGAGGTSLTGGLSLTNGNNANNGWAKITLKEDLNGTNLKSSNIQKQVVTTGVKGYRYILNTSSSTTVGQTAGTFVTTNYIDVPNAPTGRWLHIAPQDGAGNIGPTSHIWIEPTYKITYILNGGTVDPEHPNPTGYTPTTPDFTLTNPEKPGSEFIGWTGTGIDPNDPQMEVTVPKGSTGDLTFIANWAQDVPYVDAIKLHGDVYTKPGTTNYYWIQAGQVFDMEFNSHIKNHVNQVIYTPLYAVTHNYYQIKDRDGNYTQLFLSKLAMDATSTLVGTWEKNDTFEFKINDTNTKRTTSNKYLNTTVKGKLENHLDQITAYPKAGVVKEREDGTIKENYSKDFDETKKVTIIADGVAPTVTDNIIDDGLYTDGILPIRVNAKDDDTRESGIKNLKVTIKNMDTLYEEVLFDKTNTDWIHETEVEYVNSEGTKGLIIKDNDNYVGEIQITVRATDNVNNVTEYVKTVFVISLEAEIKRMLPTIDKDGNIIPDSVFKDGEQGEIIIRTIGFIDQLDIVFDKPIQDLAKEQDYEYGEDVEIPLPNNGDDKNQNIRTTPSTDPDTLKPRRADEYFFNVPMGTWVENPVDPEDNVHYIVIRAHKKHKVISNVLTIGSMGEVLDTTTKLEIEGASNAEIRTRIQERED